VHEYFGITARGRNVCVDQGKDGQISTHEDGRSLGGLYRYDDDDDDDCAIRFKERVLYPSGPDKDITTVSCKGK
jgi:hypothetical protein